MTIGSFVPPTCRIYTPWPLASAMVEACFVGPEQVWLEPSFGEGVFLKALASRNVSPSQVFGIELDDSAVGADGLCVAMTGVDALSWLRDCGRSFDVVLGNPPYASLSAVSADIRAAAQSIKVPGLCDVGLPGTANLWIAFVYAGIARLNIGGALCFVLPSAFEHATYAEKLRAALPRLFGSVSLYRSSRSLFPRVQDGCVVLLAKDFGGRSQGIDRIGCSGLEDVINALREARPAEVQSDISGFRGAVSLRDFATLRLGGVTGDVSYFVMRESQRLDFGLPEEAFVPVLSRARHLVSPNIGRPEWERLKARDEPVWLFRPIDCMLRRKSVRSYLAAGIAGACRTEGYKVRSRQTWYHTTLPPRVDALVSGLSSGYPRISLVKWRALSATNTLYTLQFDRALSINTRFGIAASLLTSVVRQQLKRSARIYTSGLVKVEPRDLMSVYLPGFREDVDYRREYAKIFTAHGEGSTERADKLFDISSCA